MFPEHDWSEPENQSVIRRNMIDDQTDGVPKASCPGVVPASNGIGHLGGDSPEQDNGPGDIAAVRDPMGVAEFEITAEIKPFTPSETNSTADFGAFSFAFECVSCNCRMS